MSETAEQLHVARRRAIHEAAARRLQRSSTWPAVPTTILAAVAGSHRGRQAGRPAAL